ncbi:MAG: O-antigen ligase family protein [Prevotellaceae bacterium]|jgi:hypothetical protein|nr:O-antigen ligase family protein [Prevotellaceae bacterium]
MKKNKFLYITLIFSILSFISIYVLSLSGLAKIENERIVRFAAIGVFFVVAVIVALNEAIAGQARNDGYIFAKIFKTNLLVTISFAALLVLSIFPNNFGIYSSGVFVGTAAFALLCNGKIYKPAWCYYFLFFYAIFLLFGTIGTSKGFRFPELTYSFYAIPISFIAFQFSEETLIKIARFFFRVMIIYVIISILYWWFNFNYLDVNFAEWVIKKVHIPTHINDWTYQNELSPYGLYPAFYFVSSWSYYFHPSFNSFVLFFALISGFYLFFKSKIDKFELIFFIVILLFWQLLTESRVGVIGTLLISIVSFCYYFRKKIAKPKSILLICLTGCFLFLFFNNNKQWYLLDETRKTDFTLAINYIENHKLWGSGYFEQTKALREQEEIMKDTLPKIWNGKYYVHNQLLGNMVQFGIWGGIALIMLLAAIIIFAVKRKSYPLLMFILSVILFMMIEEPLYGQTGITRFTVFFVFFVAIAQSNEKIPHFDLYLWLKNKFSKKCQN